MKLKHYEPKHVPEVHRVIDLTADPPTERVVVNLTDAPFYVEKPYWSDGPSSKILRTLPNDRVSLLPTLARMRHPGKHAKRRLAALRRWIRASLRTTNTLTVLAVTAIAAVGALMLTAAAGHP